MEQKRNLLKRIDIKEIAFVLLYLIVVFIFSFYFAKLRFSLNFEYPPATLASLLSQSAAKPFQFRVLVPWFVNWVLGLKCPIPILHSAFYLFFLAELFSVFFLAIAFRYYLSLFFSNKTLSALLSFSIFYVLPFNYILPRNLALFYPYDMLGILFFTLGLILIYKKNWPLYYILFIAATFNRETTCFLTLIYLFTAAGKARPKTIFLHCLFQFIIWFFIKFLLVELYINNPGPLLSEFYDVHGTPHVLANIYFLKYPSNYLFLFSSFGFIWILVLLYFPLVDSGFVKRSLIVIFPFFLTVMFLGNIFELRILGEITPIILTAFLLIVKNLFARQIIPAS